jgi:drug/metabolite transporter (DMT)-like permease
MILGLIGAFGSALCYGIASVLQALAARQTTAVEGLDIRLMLRLTRSWRYLLGLACDGAAFLLSLAALRTMPLFVVQSIVASFLAVTAVLSAVVLKTALPRVDRIGIAVVVAGLILVGLSAAEDAPVPVARSVSWGVLAAAVVLVVVAVPLARLRGRAGAAALGSVAGLGFSVVAVATRVLPAPLTIRGVLTDPATYALVLSGALALLTYSTAVQRGSVTVATAPLVVLETVAPAAVGLLLLGDSPRPGWGWVAAAGFVIAVLGALSLARHGELPPPAESRAGGTTAAPPLG